MVTGFLFFWLIMVLTIAAYRRRRGLDDPSSQGNALLEMMNENAMRELREQGGEDAERTHREIDESTQRYLEDQQNYDIYR